jgi:hypothetical protein
MVKNRKVKKREPDMIPKPAVEAKRSDKPAGWSTDLIYIIILSVLYLLVYSYTFDEKLDLNGDNAYYYVLGKALSLGEGYVNIASITRAPNNHFPPGYPFILSLFMHLSDSTTFLKILNGFFLYFSLMLLYVLFRRISGNLRIAFVTVFFLTLNSHLLQYGTMLMSEISFILFSYLCLLLVDRGDLGNDFYKKPWFYLILITLVASYYIRSTGLALFGGIILYLLIHKKWKVAISLAAGFLLLALPWILRGQKLGGSSYLEPLIMVNPYRPELGNADLGGYVVRFFSNLSRYITREIPNSSFPFIQVNYASEITPGEWFVGIVILAVSLYGFYRIGRRGLLFICYLLGTFGILLLWPEVWRGVRFILPVMPLILFSVLTGIYFLVIGMLSPLKIKFNMLLLIVFGLAFIQPVKLLHQKALSPYPASWQNYFSIAEWFRNENLQDVVVICRKPMLFHLKSGTYTAPYLYSKEPREILEDLKTKKADYVVLDNLGYRQTYEYLYPVVRNNPQIFPLVFSLQNPDTYLLKFSPEN